MVINMSILYWNTNVQFYVKTIIIQEREISSSFNRVVNPVRCHSVYTPWIITLYRATECCDILKLPPLPPQTFSTQIQSHAQKQISVIIFWMWEFQSHTMCQKCYSSIRKIPLLLKKLKTVQHLHIKKAVPLQAWTGPEGSRRLRLPDF
jgi:hypothetical protein